MCLLFNTLYDKITQLSIHNTYIGDKYMSILDAIILGIVQGVAEFFAHFKLGTPCDFAQSF